jgi:xanthine dehydrogenase accessory factor
VSWIRAPAGLDLHARLLEEIAVSILAEIVQREAARGKVVAAQKDCREARDPVCGTLMNVSTVKQTSARNGTEVYFCCASCKQSLERQAEKYELAV